MAGISAHQQTDHMPSTDEVFYIMLALLQFGVPAALPSFRKDPAVLVMFACSPKITEVVRCCTSSTAGKLLSARGMPQGTLQSFHVNGLA